MNPLRLVLAPLLALLLAACATTEVVPLLPTGAECVFPGDCAGQVCLPERVTDGVVTAWAGGACSRDCASQACAEGEACTDLADGRFCLPACQPADADCRAGYVCSPAVQACLPDCRLGWDCGEALECDQQGLCVPPAPVGDNGIGRPCTWPGDCTGQQCLKPGLVGGRRGGGGMGGGGGGGPGMVAGFCTLPCGAQLCPAGSACAPLGPSLFCLATCAGERPCAPGTMCDAAHGLCVPDCRRGWPCPPGATCAADGVCRAR
jgi:hypothetical protein